MRFCLLSVLLAVGCGAPAAPPPASPGTPAAPPEASVPSAPAAVPAAAPDLTACLPASVRDLDATVAETARADDGAGELVLFEFLLDGADPVAEAVSFRPVLLRVEDGACESLLPERTDSFDLRAHASPDALAELLRENAAWHAERVGGAEVYAERLAEGYGGTLAECAERSLEGGFCVDPDRSAALRAIGIPVVRPDR